jgi:CubicO group peptidase (beta-lactamase class C family)
VDLSARVGGPLRIERRSGHYSAAIAGLTVSFAPRGDSVQFLLPDGRGRFRGAWSAERRVIEGFWIDPPGEGLEQPYASPLVLEAEGHDVWRGTVVPLEDRFTLDLWIVRGANDSLVGAFRNPEYNLRSGASRFRVVRDRDSLRFSAWPDTTRPQIRFAAAFVGAPDRIRIDFPGLGRTLELTRPSGRLAASARPRPASEPPYAYRPPPALADGWPTAPAADAGMNQDSLARLVERLIHADPSVARPALIHSLLIARRGKLVLEEYFYGFDREAPHDLRSAGKTYASVLVGAAMRSGAPIAPETRVYRLLDRMGPFAHPDPRKERITVAHLMTHSTGLASDDNDDASPGNEQAMQSQKAQPDWWKYTLDLPMAHDPGTQYAYSSGGMNLVGAALWGATGRWVPELFDRLVARPLGFGRWYWNLSPTLEGYTGGGARVRPRDLLKLGQAYLDGGLWRGRRIVDSSWVARSVSPQAGVPEESAGFGTSDALSLGDGYAWHLYRLRSGDRTYRMYEANGNGGQLLMVVPELELVVAFTAGNYGQGGIWGRFRDQILTREIIPAVGR